MSSAKWRTFYLVLNMLRIYKDFLHDDVIKWKHFLCYWPFVRGIYRSLVNSPHKGQWRGALMLSFICAWINGWVNNREAGDLRRHRAHYDVTVMIAGTAPWMMRVATHAGHSVMKILFLIYFRQKCEHLQQHRWAVNDVALSFNAANYGRTLMTWTLSLIRRAGNMGA